jgi:hypothetical protein
MMKNDVPIGKNRTGIALSPVDQKELLEVTDLTVPSMEGDERDLAEARAEYLEDHELIGSVPPPASVKGVASTGVAAVKGVNATVLIDKLSERLAFERTGTRLYGALIGKCESEGEIPGGPTVGDLQQIQAEELAHFELVREAIVSLGADPTAMTPSADMTGVASSGILQVITDSRTSLRQSLEAILIAELVDNEGWELLIDLTRAAGRDTLAERFETAAETEDEHLSKVRAWVSDATMAAARPAAAKEKGAGKA